MIANVPNRTLPIRRWLALALVVAIVIPVLITVVVAFHLLGIQDNANITTAEQVLSDTPSRWHDPNWQAGTTAELNALGVDFLLVEAGREIYRSEPDPFTSSNTWNGTRLVRRLELSGTDPTRIAYIFADQNYGPPQEGQFWLVPVIGLTSLLVTLGGIAWFVGRTVVRPLAAASDAALKVASGDLDVTLPSSEVREVAEVNQAFEMMSTELRASLQHQAELEQERRLFIGAIVHDLRTPLFSLRGYLEGLEKGMDDTPEKRARYISGAQEKATSLERLISDLFEFTRMEYLEQTPNREPLDVRTVLQRLIEGLRPQAEAKGVRLNLDCPSEPCVVDGDAHQLTRALENLLDNALRYTPSGGSVRIGCQIEPEGIHILVADTGPGIPAHDLPHLFTPMYRGETSRNRRTGGAGLGLTIARRILQAHGGDLTASNGETGGAVFVGTLPRSASVRL